MKLLNNSINILKISYINKKKKIFIKLNNKVILFLNILVNISYILNYHLISKNKVVVYLNYKKKQITFNNIKSYYRTSHLLFFSSKIFKKKIIYEKKKLFIFFFKNKIFDQRYFLKNKKNCFLLCVIF